MARVINLPLNNPAKMGLNKQESASILGMEWATELQNAIYNANGAIAARKGFKNTNATTITDTPRSLYEYIDDTGQTIYITGALDTIYKKDGTSLTDITGTATTPTAGNWKFTNFNGVCVGFQADHNPIVITSVGGSFADISLSGTQQPSTSVNEVLAAFGRLWVIDGTDLKYCDLLDYTAWNSVYDLHSYWGAGGDTGIALAEFNGNLVVFGYNNIIIYDASGGAGSLVKTEVLNGIGCIARDSVQQVGDDLWFLSHSGVMSLRRTIQEKSMPLRDVSKNVRDYMINLVGSTYTNIKSTYNELEGFYLLSLPDANRVFCFDTKVFLPDGSARASEWIATWTSLFSSPDHHIQYLTTTGFLNTYTGYYDNVASDGSGGDDYNFLYVSPWTDMGQIDPSLSSRLKILKRAAITVFTTATQDLSLRWYTDFSSTLLSETVSVTANPYASYYGIAQYGIGTYSSSVNLVKAKTPMSRTGQFFKFGIYANISGSSFSLQFLNIEAKIGRETI